MGNKPMTETMYYVLLTLLKPCHGYQIMASIKELSHNRLTMGPGTLYGILNRLEKQKHIEMVQEIDRKKIYAITESGRNLLISEYKRLQEMVRDGKIIGEENL